MKRRSDDVVCGKCRRLRYKFSARQCPHEAVQRVYGEGCYICMYCCAKCKHNYRGEWGGQRCDLWKGNKDDGTEKKRGVR